MSPMVQRVARALAEKTWPHCGGADGCNLVSGQPNWTFMVEPARTALKAIRYEDGTDEPALIAASACFSTDPVQNAEFWDRMIEEVLR